MESVLSKANTVMVDVKNNNVMYLPLDKLAHPALTQEAETTESTAIPATPATSAAGVKSFPPIVRPSLRETADERGRSDVREERARFVREERVRQ
jgi:hypothetical protein